MSDNNPANKKTTCPKGTRVYTVLSSYGGVPETPEVFSEESEADQCFIDLVNGIHDTNFTDYNEASEYQSANWIENNVRYFMSDVR